MRGFGRRLFAWVSVVISAGSGFSTTAFWVSSGPASAVACLGSPYNTTAQPDTNGRGVRVSNPGMLIENKTVSCGRVSSLFDKNSTETRWVEVGWYENQNYYVCIPNATSPRRLGFASLDGVYSCFKPSGGIAEGTDAFSVHVANQDGVWKFFHEGTNWSSPAFVDG